MLPYGNTTTNSEWVNVFKHLMVILLFLLQVAILNSFTLFRLSTVLLCVATQGWTYLNNESYCIKNPTKVSMHKRDGGEGERGRLNKKEVDIF